MRVTSGHDQIEEFIQGKEQGAWRRADCNALTPDLMSDTPEV